MDTNSHKSRHERREDRDEMEDSPRKEHRDREKERRKEKEHKSRDRERDRDKEIPSREKRKEDRDDRVRDKDYDRDKHREKEREREREKDHRRDRERDRDGGMEKESERGRDKDRGKEKTRERDRESEKERDRDRAKQKEREKDRDKDREKSKEKSKEKEREVEKEKERSKDRANKKSHEEEVQEWAKDGGKYDFDGKYQADGENNVEDPSEASELEQRISKMREERVAKKSEAASEVLTWVSKSRKLEEKRNAQKEKAMQLSKILEEQDNLVQGGSEDDEPESYAAHDLAGVKVLHGLDKVMEGGAVVLTLKDQSVLADGDVNNDIDMLENVEIGEQKRRDEAYRAAKKKTGTYDDKFNDEPGAEKKMLPQYDEPKDDGAVTLDAKGRFSGEAEKKLEELRRRIQGQTSNPQFEDLSSSAKVSSDYYSQEEMLRFKKPKKKKSLRKKEKLDIDAIEAEAVAAGLGAQDLGRRDGRRQAMRQEQERSEAEKRSNAYQSAIAKAEEASRSLRMEQVLPVKVDEDENKVFADDEDDLYKSLERARKLALKKQSKAPSGPESVARLATSTTSQTVDNNNSTTGEAQENKVVFTEMEEFVWGLQLDEDVRKPDSQDVFMDEDEAPRTSDQEMREDDGGWAEVPDTNKDEIPLLEQKEETAPDETIHEVAVGKGLSGALKLLKERGSLKETVEWGGRNMDKKKSKLVGIVDADDDGNTERFKDIRIERTDEFGRILTPKEAFRLLSHKFHGKGPGKMKQEKRMKQYYEELKLKQMKNSDTPSLSVERMREAQAQLKAPYLVLSGHVKPGQTSDPQSGFATVEKDPSGGLTPMLGDRKVEHFLGIKRKAEPGNSSAPKKPKT